MFHINNNNDDDDDDDNNNNDNDNNNNDNNNNNDDDDDEDGDDDDDDDDNNNNKCIWLINNAMLSSCQVNVVNNLYIMWLIAINFHICNLNLIIWPYINYI